MTVPGTVAINRICLTRRSCIGEHDRLMKTILAAIFALSTSAIAFSQTTAEIAKEPFKYQAAVVMITPGGGTLKQTGATVWEYKIYSSPRVTVVEINDAAGADLDKRKSPVYCQIREITANRVYLTALGNSKSTAMGGQASYSWRK